MKEAVGEVKETSEKEVAEPDEREMSIGSLSLLSTLPATKGEETLVLEVLSRSGRRIWQGSAERRLSLANVGRATP